MADRCSLVAVFVLLTAASMSAQDAPPPTFKSGVDLVRFDVRVVDANGRPITDLKPDEIEILDDGAALPVVLFQRVHEPAGNYVEDALRATTAEVSSNTAFPRGHLYILIFDQQHITPGNEQRARLAAEQFIGRRVLASDRVALFALPGPGPRMGFAADKTRAIEALSSIRGTRERAVASPLGAMTAYEAHRVVQGDETLITNLSMRMAAEAGDVVTGARDALGGAGAAAADSPEVMRRVLQENARALVNQTDSESRQFLQRLADVITSFRDLEGRKTVILFSEGFIQDNLSRELEDVAAAAAQSYSVFYTMDLNLRTPSLTQAYASDTTLGGEIQARLAPLSTLAVETDGAMILDVSARSGAELDKIADAGQDYYLVGFTPPADGRAQPGHYRRVTVTVRRPGARVSARTGYAIAPPAAAPADRRRSVEALLAAPFVQQGLKVDYTTYSLKGADQGRQRVVLSLTADLPVRSNPGDAADVVFVVRDGRDGRVVESGSGTMPLPAAVRTGTPLGQGVWRVQFSLPPGSYLMRSVVREPGGLAGSADRRVEVRALDGPDVTVSDMIVASAIAGLPVRPRAYTDSGLNALLETYARTAGQLGALDVRVGLRRPSDNTSVVNVQAELLPIETDSSGARRRAQLTLPLHQVPPGDYVAHAVVRAGGEVVGERTRQVEIVPGTAPPAAEEIAGGNTWTPIEILQGSLAKQYVAWLAERAKGTPAAGAAALATQNRWEQVALDLKQAPASGGVAQHALIGLARFVAEDYAAAAAALTLAQTAAPESALTAFFLGWAHDGAGQSRAALSAWRVAAHLDPTLVSVHLALADGYLKISQPALAIQALRAGLAALPSSSELQSRLQLLEGVRQ